MRRVLASAGVAVGLTLSAVPAASAANPLPCERYLPQKPVCVPSWCLTAALVVDAVNNAAGQPLGSNPPPNCID